MNFQGIVNLLNQGFRVTLEQRLRDVLAPAHMKGPWSQKWLGVLGAFAEIVYQGSQEAADVGFANRCPDDALDHVGANENIERLIDEPDGTYRNRLRTPFATWQQSGTAAGIEAQLNAFGVSDVTAIDEARGWNFGDGNTWTFSRFNVVINQPGNWSLLLAADDVIASDDLVAGVDGMTRTDYRNLRRIVHKWRSAHSAPVNFYLDFDGSLAGTTTADADAAIASETAVDLQITRPYADTDIYASETTYAGYFIEPI